MADEVTKWDRDAAFAVFWESYWRRPRVGKKAARLAFKRAVQSEAVFAAVMRGIKAQAPDMLSRDSYHFIPHASTWLNGECWTDEVEDDLSEEEVTLPPAHRVAARREEIDPDVR